MTSQDDIDVRKIVEDLKREIEREYTPQEILAFEPVDFSSSMVYQNPNGAYEESFLESRLTDCFNDRVVNWDRPIPGGKISRNVKRVIRKLVRFFIAPIVEDQNRFNFDITDVALQMQMKVELQQVQIDDLKRRIHELESK